MDAAGWDARYATRELVWGAEPNRFVAAELESLPPRAALDLACGEGRNGIWLATHGWRVTGVDFSSTAVERARRLAEEAGVDDRCTFVVGDVVAGPFPDGPYDAVVVAYLHLPATARRAALRNAAVVLAPGGTLLVVAHDTANLTEGTGGPQDPSVLYSADDVVADLADLPGLLVEKAQAVHRPVQSDAGPQTAVDVLVRVRRQ